MAAKYGYKTHKHVKAYGTAYFSYTVFEKGDCKPRYVFRSIQEGIATQLRATAVRYAKADIRAILRNNLDMEE